MFSKIVEILKSFVGHMGAYFMIVVLSLSLMSGADRVFDPSYYGIAILFSVLLSLCSYILKIRAIKSNFVLALLHIIFSTIAFVISFILASGIISGSTGFVGAVLYVVIDTIAMAILFVYKKAISSSSSKKIESNAECNSSFKQ